MFTTLFPDSRIYILLPPFLVLILLIAMFQVTGETIFTNNFKNLHSLIRSIVCYKLR